MKITFRKAGQCIVADVTEREGPRPATHDQYEKILVALADPDISKAITDKVIADGNQQEPASS